MTIVFKDVEMTKFLQSADVFESGKVMLKCSPLSVTTSTPFAEFVQKMLAIEGDIAPIAVMDCDTKEEWRDETVQSVSTGYNWVLLDKYLPTYGFRRKEAK
jgi:hypothetical protein